VTGIRWQAIVAEARRANGPGRRLGVRKAGFLLLLGATALVVAACGAMVFPLI